MAIISLTKEISSDNPYSFPARHTANLVLIENAICDIDTNITSVSGGLQVQIDNNYSTIQTVSGGLQLQIDNLQFLDLTDTPNTYAGADTYVPIISANQIVFVPQTDIVPASNSAYGSEDCIINQQVYDISYGQTISGGATPVVSLTIPASGSTIFVQGTYDISDTGFKVVLSGPPAISGYAVNWIVNFENSINLQETRYLKEFTNADLSLGSITLSHNLSEKYVSVSVYNNSDGLVEPDLVTLIDSNSLNVDLTSIAPISGSWNALVISK